MESFDLNSRNPDDAQLEEWLRTNATVPPLPDGGFSSRVLSALPPSPVIARHSWARLVWGGTGALAGLAVFAAQGTSWTDFYSCLLQLGENAGNLTAAFSNPTTQLALAITGLSLLVAFHREGRRGFSAW